MFLSKIIKPLKITSHYSFQWDKCHTYLLGVCWATVFLNRQGSISGVLGQVLIAPVQLLNYRAPVLFQHSGRSLYLCILGIHGFSIRGFNSPQMPGHTRDTIQKGKMQK